MICRLQPVYVEGVPDLVLVDCKQFLEATGFACHQADSTTEIWSHLLCTSSLIYCLYLSQHGCCVLISSEIIG